MGGDRAFQSVRDKSTRLDGRLVVEAAVARHGHGAAGDRGASGDQGIEDAANEVLQVVLAHKDLGLLAQAGRAGLLPIDWRSRHLWRAMRGFDSTAVVEVAAAVLPWQKAARRGRSLRSTSERACEGWSCSVGRLGCCWRVPPQ